MLKRLWIGFLYFIVRGLVAIRYRLKVIGLEKLTPQALSKTGGILFLPNHPAEIDPVLMIIVLWRQYRIHPLVVEYFYFLKGAHYLLTLVDCVPIPDFNGAVNKWKQKKVEKAFTHIGEKLKQRENFLIYPSGRLKLTPEEIIGGASFVHTLLQQVPETNVVLVRTTGLWGSRFSRALTGDTPNFGKVLWEGLKIVLKNLIFLTPRREVVIEIEPAGADLPVKGNRLEFNQYLERWYNRGGPEPLKLVTDSFWGESVPAVQAKKVEQDSSNWSIDPQIESVILAKIGELARRTDIKREQSLDRDLGLDSLDTAQLYVFLDQQYEVGDIPLGELRTVEDILKVVARKEQYKEPASAGQEKRWPDEDRRPPPLPPQGKTFQEVFLNNCDRMDRFVACSDAALGVMTYRRFKMIVLILRRKILKMKGDHVGILMPSVTMTYALILATLLAKKVPVMLNWTVGARALDHCRELAGLEVVISSRKFLDNLNSGDLGTLDDILVLLEDIKPTISLWDKLQGVYGLFKNAQTLLKEFDLAEIPAEAPAVILFTSGTESLPKGVPLSHKNILFDLHAAMECFEFMTKDILYGILPPFHSFGFSATGMMPLLIGLKVYYAPDPTHIHAMVHDIENWKITLFISTPTFIRGVFRHGAAGQMKSLRYAVGGAEKVPDELFEFMQKNGGAMLEGYGITECAPVVTLTRPGKPRQGVGQPLPGIDLCIIDPETKQRLPQGQDGEICIDGPNVFNGYLGNPREPFIQLEGRRWYLSGDRGHLEADGSLILTGRLKRFVKIGGEMVSLGGLEEEILRLAREKKWAPETQGDQPLLVAAAKEQNTEKAQIIVFSTIDLNKDEINAALRDRGYGRLIKIAEVRRIPQIPMTGTGKINYREIDEKL
jgi:long-chain-fatty-acid--[acyl-carrier-protein] ligase